MAEMAIPVNKAKRLLSLRLENMSWSKSASMLCQVPLQVKMTRGPAKKCENTKS